MARFAIGLLVVLSGVLPFAAAQSCNDNFVTKASNGGTCPSTRSCETVGGCCGSCSGNGGNCFAYTCGQTCQNTPCSSCPAGFVALPSDDTGSRPSGGTCPSTSPHKTTSGCCGGCLAGDGTVYAYDCGLTCSNTGCTPSQLSSPPPASSSPPPGSIITSPPPSGGQAVAPPGSAHFCDIVKNVLPSSCTCTETTGSTGLRTTCSKSITGIGTIGARVQVEPCGSPAFAEISYQFGSGWESATRIEAGATSLLLAIPGAAYSALGHEAGAYISIDVAGNAADLSVHARLSLCLNDKCDGEMDFIGSFAEGLGFPMPLLEFDDLVFTDNCPAFSEGDPCFPSDAQVTLANGTAIRIDALTEGDSIMSTTVDGVLSSDVVTLLSIAQPKATSPFVLLSTADSTIKLTDEHHLPVGPTCCNTLKKAKDIALGEMVWIVRTHGIESALVTKKSMTYGVGLHSPVLMNGGFPVVDGFVTAFDSIDKVYLAKSGFAPLLKACKATGTCERLRNMFFGGDAKYIVLANAKR